MIIHNPNHWVGGTLKKSGWVLTYPISSEIIEESIQAAGLHSVREHRMLLLKCTQVYDDWWYKQSGRR